jgi:predicted TIM-barrel fold metal-dependent hydrolase
VPFCTQVGHTGPMRGSETGRPIPYLDEVALCRKYPNVYIDTSAYTIKRYPRELVDYLRADGRHKVLFGTNHPMITPDRALRELPWLELGEEATALFLAGNARRAFGLHSGIQKA